MHDTNAKSKVNEISPNELEDDDVPVSLSVAPRGNPAIEKPYCWQSKPALRLIRASYGDDPTLPYLMSTYLALTEIASDEGQPVFTKTVSEILSKAGGSDRKMRESLGLLEHLRLLHIKHNFVSQKGKAPSTYTLLTLRHGVPDPPAQKNIGSVPILIKNANAKNLNKRKNTHHQSTKAERDEKKAAAEKQELADALKHIASVAGGDTADNMKKRKRAEVLELAGLQENDILKVRGLVNAGWTVAKARKYKMTAPSACWRHRFSEGELRIIDEYNRVCVPRGWRAVDADSEELHRALAVFVASDDYLADERMFLEAIEKRARDPSSKYNCPRGNKLLRILWRNQ